MDAEELKVVLGELREIRNLGLDDLRRRASEEMRAVCEKRGPHEYIETNGYGNISVKVCKFCGKNEVN